MAYALMAEDTVLAENEYTNGNIKVIIRPKLVIIQIHLKVPLYIAAMKNPVIPGMV